MIFSQNLRININYRRVFTFCLIIIQSIGIRFFEGQGILFSILIIALSYNSLKLLTPRDYRFLIISFLFLVICKIANPSFLYTSLIFQSSLIIAAYLFIIQYRIKPYMLQSEFFIALRFFTFHAIIGYILYLIIPDYFKDFNVMNKSLFYLFYVSTGDFMGFQKNSGLFWEPGVLQLVANLYLFYCIKFKKNIYQIIIAGLAVVSSFSTTGLIILIINFFYFFYLKFRTKQLSFFNISLVIIALMLFIPILKENASNKMGGKNTSGLVRLRDLQVGIELIKEKPIIGHGQFNTEYLISKNYINKIESNLFSKEYIKASGDMGGGYTNGLLGLVVWYGIPMSLLLYFFYFKSKFVEGNFIERFLFCLIPLLSMISEPIAYTSLFLMFPFSYWILNVKYTAIKKNKTYEFYFNNRCNL